MVRVEESVERLAVPAEAEVDSGPECLGDPFEPAGRDAAAVPAFDAGDEGRTDPDGLGEVTLPPAAAQAERADPATESNHVHVDSVTLTAYLSITRAGPSGGAH